MPDGDPFLLQLPPIALDEPLMLEASAGTGKTYTLTRLVLAYLLYKNIPIDKILIITFTRNATAELKDRMAQLLRESLRNPDLPQDIKVKLTQITADFDNLNITTINAFLQQIFQSSSLETAANSRLKPADDTSWLNETAHDYFRRFSTLFDEDHHMQLALLAFTALAKKKNPFGKDGALKNFSDCFPWLIDNILNKPFLGEHDIYPCENASQIAWEIEEEYALGKGKIFTAFHRAIHEENSGMNELNLSLEMMLKAVSVTELLILLGVCESSSPWKKLCGKTIRKNYPRLQELYEILSPLVNNGTQKNPHLAAMAAHFLRHFHHHTRLILKEKQERLNIMRIEDPTAYLYDLLQKGTGRALLNKLRRYYSVALIDEFQDTSHFQWTILHKLFQPNGADDKHSYALIGDPKQLIYYFRGITPQTYADARKELPSTQVYQLKDNFRSHHNVLRAINSWFSHLFADTSHGYTPVRAANEHVARLAFPGGENQAGVTFLTCEKSFQLLPNGKAKEISYALCAQQIAELLHKKDYQLIDDISGERRRVRGRDIACLVDTHDDGKKLKATLNSWHIPSTLLENSSSIYETEEYELVLLFLKTLTHPSSRSLCNRVLLSPLFNLAPEQILLTQENLPRLEEFYIQFNTWRHQANNRKIAQVFDQIFYQHGYFQRLMVQNNGERKFVNMRHLVSILLREERTAGINSGPNYLYQRLKILKEQNSKEDLAKIRLETDTDAVRILNIHQAKGLEYGIVFGIFGIKNLSLENSEYAMQKNQKPILDMGLSEEHNQAHLQENLHESMRKFYVMATRVKSHLFLPLVITKEVSYYSHSLAYLIDKRLPQELINLQTDAKDPALSSQSKEKNERKLKFETSLINISQQIKSLAEDPAQPFSCINLEIQPPPLTRSQNLPQELLEDLSVAVLQHTSGFNERIRHISSYTSLWQNKQSEEDEDNIDEIIIEDTNPIILDEHSSMTPLSLYGGTSLGNALHAIMENLPFHFADASLEDFLQNPHVHDIADIMISRYMSVNYHYDRAYIKTVKEMIWNSLNTPIEALDNLRLAQLKNTDKLHEVEFMLHIPEDYLLQTPSLRTGIKHGYLRGFLDLIFTWQGRYFILDWKTTRLGHGQSAYAKEYLSKAMAEHGYDMQALIYTYALSQYLQTKTGANEDKIGGVIYIFCRGANPEYPGYGLDIQYPKKEDIERLFTRLQMKS